MEPITIAVTDLVAIALLALFPALAWWQWYTDPKRPTKKGKNR